MTNELFRDRQPIRPLAWDSIKDVFHLGDATNQAPVEALVPLQILHTLGDVPPVAKRARNPD